MQDGQPNQRLGEMPYPDIASPHSARMVERTRHGILPIKYVQNIENVDFVIHKYSVTAKVQ